MNLFTVTLSALMFCTVQSGAFSDTPDTVPAKTYGHAVGIAPLALLSLGMGAKYEFKAGEKTTVFLEGAGTRGSSLSATEGWQGGLGFRYYFKEALKGRYVGTFFKYADIKSELDVEIERTSYHYELEGHGLWALGLHYGNRRIWKNGFTLDWRIGYGFGNTKLTWNPAPIQELKLSKSLMDATAGLDSELNIGLAF